MHRLALPGLLIAAALCPAEASTLGTWNGNFGATAYSANTPVTGMIAFGTETDSPCGYPYSSYPDCVVLFSPSLTPVSVGDIFTFNSASTGFAEAVSLFTDNTPDYLWELGEDINGGGGNGNTEASRFGLPPGQVDFGGDTITSVTMQITNSQFVAGNNYSVYSFQLQVNGTAGVSATPEPSTWAMLAGGIPALYGLRRRRPGR